MDKEPSHDAKILARLLFQQSTSYTDNDCTPLFSASHPVPKFSLFKWIKNLLFPHKLSKDSYVEVVHYWDTVKGEEFKGTGEMWRQWCKFIGRKP